MSLFLNTSILHNLYADSCSKDVGESIERDCLSVLHKLHDQVNGLQLVQVVVQPLAKLFNPASLAALAANNQQSSSSAPNNPPATPSSTVTSSPEANNPTSSTYMMSPDTAQALIARLDTDRDVNWLMEIIGYGLSMPFSLNGEQDSVKDCCTIYCEWLVAALLPYNEQNEDSNYQQLCKLVPSPIRMDPNRYARKMVSHLYNVFLPRHTFNQSSHKDQSESNLTSVSRQAVLCHRVLRTIEKIAQDQNNLMDNETWEHFLALLLTVNDKLLSVPTEPDDIGTQLHDRTLGVLFDLMLLANSKSIPSSSLWKTFHEMSLNWRHRPALVDHWKRLTLLLTRRIVVMPQLVRSGNQDQTYHQTENPTTGPIELSIASMSYENLSQTWYRFLNLIGNPIELSNPNIISRTDEFYDSACRSDNVLDPRQHPCLNILPQIFNNSMSCLKDLIETFLGTYQSNQTSPLQTQFKFSPERPKCNSILHVFGDWLFSAALISSDLNQETNCEAAPSIVDPILTPDSFEAGQAEAMAILCKIFSSKSSTEDVSPTYLSRFYLCLQHCLESRQAIKRQLLSSVLMNSTTILQKDLDGINLLVPSFINAIEFVFECSEREIPPVQPPPRQHSRSGSIRSTSTNQSVTNYDLRRACILTLNNLLTYPLHFQDLVIRNCLNESSPTTTFGSLRPRLLKLLFVALQTETDSTNMQTLFGGLSLTIHDLAANMNRIQFSKNSLDLSSWTGFLLKSLHVTCNLLINIWKHDTQVSLAALELLTTIARVSTKEVEMKNEYKQTTKWICDYICNQCSRPPPAHSRDMHSTIVAAYQCLSVWFSNHPYLLNDESCLKILMEVIELGVCGQKSKTMSGFIGKGDKVMKPSSMRVREAAESVLNVCMVLDEMNQRSISSRDKNLDEQAILEMTGPLETKQNEVYKSFKYFSDEDSMIFGLYDRCNHEASLRDSVICLLRTPFGRHCWKIKFSYYTDKTKEKIIANKTLGLIKRPFQQVTPSFESRIFSFTSGQNKSIYFNQKAKFFPDSIEDIPTNDLDNLVTTIDDYCNTKVKDQRLKNDLDKISKIFKHQISAEQKVMSECSIRIKRVECEEPQALSDLDTARIIVAHFGFNKSLNSLTSITLGEEDRVNQSFINDLKSLDRESVRICDSVNIFYVRKNLTKPKEIIESVRERHNVNLAFFEWILELGRATVVKNTRRPFVSLSNTLISQSQSSIKSSVSSHTSARIQMLTSDHGGAIFDGERMILHWSDMSQELSFMIPHKLDKIDPTVNIIVCWLECPDDIVHVPTESLLLPSFNTMQSNEALLEDGSNASTNSSNNTVQTSTNQRHTSTRARDYAKYYISTMKNGLYQVNLETSFNRNWLALPLVDGMTVSKGVLGNLIRESILNLCRRQRLYADSYQPPHVRRRFKIQEICNNYKVSSRYESAEFYNNLFRS